LRYLICRNSQSSGTKVASFRVELIGPLGKPGFYQR
jgi:hypothetical protein